MSRSNADDDPRFKKAVRKIVDNITISVPDAMKIANFTTDEINNLSLHQRIRRAAAKARGGQKPSSISVHPSTMSSVSTLTATPPLETKHKRKNVRHTSAATQQIRKNKLVDKEEKKRAVKYATSLYANRKDLSARAVSEIVEQKLGIRVPQRTIQSYVKEGRVGTSPKKKGPQGVFDDQTVLKIGNAMESYIQIKQLNGESSDVTFKKLQNLLKQCTIKKRDCNCEWLLKRLLAVSGVDKRSEALAKFEEIRGTPAPAYGNWTDLTTKPISIGDTALGRHRTVKKMELHAAIHTMSKEEREELRNKLNVAEEMEVDEVAAPTVPILPNANPNDDQIPLPSADTQLFPDEMSDDDVDTIADNNNVQAM